jgi:VWFA-related protein
MAKEFTMGTSNSFKKFYVAFSALMILACGGGGESSAPAPAPTPNIYLAQSTIDFAGVVLDNSSDRTFVVKNTGNANLRIGQILPTSPPFNIVSTSDTCSNATLSPSSTCSLKVRFSPTEDRSFTAALSIPSNDPDTSTANISLSGVGYGLNVWINSVHSVNCPNMNAEVTVTKPRSSVLPSLAQTDFTLYQNGQSQSITVSTIQQPSPVTLVLALDWSSSLSYIRSDIQNAAINLIDELGAGDWVAICKFTEVIQFNPEIAPLFIEGNDPAKGDLNDYVRIPSLPGTGTYLYDAAFQSVYRAAQRTTSDKRVVIVLSDGVEDFGSGTGSTHTLEQVIAYATTNKISIFTIYFVAAALGENYGKPEIMQRLANETGGQYFNAVGASMADIFQQISNALNSKYTINYTTSASLCTPTISLDVVADWQNLHGRDSRTVSFP